MFFFAKNIRYNNIVQNCLKKIYKNKKINLYKLFKYSTLFIVKIIIILLNYGNNIFFNKRFIKGGTYENSYRCNGWR